MHLPNRAAALDGSSSYDDHGIVEYEWSRDPKSPAAGVSVNMKNIHLRMADLLLNRDTCSCEYSPARVTALQGKSGEFRSSCNECVAVWWYICLNLWTGSFDFRSMSSLKMNTRAGKKRTENKS